MTRGSIPANFAKTVNTVVRKSAKWGVGVPQLVERIVNVKWLDAFKVARHEKAIRAGRLTQVSRNGLVSFGKFFRPDDFFRRQKTEHLCLRLIARGLYPKAINFVAKPSWPEYANKHLLYLVAGMVRSFPRTFSMT